MKNENKDNLEALGDLYSIEGSQLEVTVEKPKQSFEIRDEIHPWLTCNHGPMLVGDLHEGVESIVDRGLHNARMERIAEFMKNKKVIAITTAGQPIDIHNRNTVAGVSYLPQGGEE